MIPRQVSRRICTPTRRLLAPVQTLSECNADFSSPLGVGAYGIVYPGCHETFSSKLAIKAPKLTRKSKVLADQEKKAYKRVLESGSFHPHVVDVLGYLEVPQTTSSDAAPREALDEACESSRYFIMERLDGNSLDHRITSRGGFSEDEARNVTRALLHGLYFLHEQGIVHRDIKPTNVFYESRSAVSEPKIIDFSHAAVLPAGVSSNTDILYRKLGTMGYAAPEVLSLKDRYNAKCDIFSLGCTMFAMVSNRKPPNTDVDTAVDQMTRYIRAICSKSAGDFLESVLKVNPQDRPSAACALEHPWLQQSDGQHSSMEEAV